MQKLISINYAKRYMELALLYSSLYLLVLPCKCPVDQHHSKVAL